MTYIDEDVTDVLKGGLGAVARALYALGNAGADTPFGGLEALGMAITSSAETVAGALSEIALAINSLADSKELS